MDIIEKNPVPIYEVVCHECKSKIQYRKSEIHFTGYITCPVCGESIWANTINHVRMDVTVTGEVIRCKDCKYYDGEYYHYIKGERMRFCKHDMWDGWNEDDFCSYAERKK